MAAKKKSAKRTHKSSLALQRGKAIPTLKDKKKSSKALKVTRKVQKPSLKDKKRSSKAKDSFGDYGAYGGLNQGGLVNPASGLGTDNDKSRQSFFLPTFFNSRTELETIIVESWAAARFVEFPVEQMFVRQRVFEGANEDDVKAYEEYLDSFELNKYLANVMKAGRLYGSAFLMFITKEAPLTEPLDLNLLREGDLLNILVFDRYSMFTIERDYNIASKNFQKPCTYTVSPKFGGTFQIHASRVLRFDGKMPLTSDGWSVYNIDYGVSEIVDVLQSIYQDSQGANGVSQLIEEASIPIVQLEGLKETLGVNAAKDSPNLDQLARTLSLFKSIYNTVYMDTTDSMERVAVNFSGLPEILDRFASRLAAAAGIPATVFLGKSPMGMNSTGESDLAINALNVAAMQVNKLAPAYKRIDDIMTRTGGFSNDFTFEFPSLIDLSETEQSDIAVKKMQVAVEGVQSDIMSSDEARAMLDGDPIVGTLEPREFDFETEFEKAQTEIASEPSIPEEGAGEEFEEAGNE